MSGFVRFTQTNPARTRPDEQRLLKKQKKRVENTTYAPPSASFFPAIIAGPPEGVAFCGGVDRKTCLFMTRPGTRLLYGRSDDTHGIGATHHDRPALPAFWRDSGAFQAVPTTCKTQQPTNRAGRHPVAVSDQHQRALGLIADLSGSRSSRRRKYTGTAGTRASPDGSRSSRSSRHKAQC